MYSGILKYLNLTPEIVSFKYIFCDWKFRKLFFLPYKKVLFSLMTEHEIVYKMRLWDKLALSNKQKSSTFGIKHCGMWVNAWPRCDQSILTQVNALGWVHDLICPNENKAQKSGDESSKLSILTARQELQINWCWGFFRHFSTQGRIWNWQMWYYGAVEVGHHKWDTCQRQFSSHDIRWAPKAVTFWIQLYAWMF